MVPDLSQGSVAAQLKCDVNFNSKLIYHYYSESCWRRIFENRSAFGKVVGRRIEAPFLIDSSRVFFVPR